MSLITACPACQTQFEVTDEQLQAYAGKVRCGECNHVFDARSHLVVTGAFPQSESEVVATASDAEVYFKVSAEAAQIDTPAETPDISLKPDIALEEPTPTWNVRVDETEHAEPEVPAFLRNVSLADERPAPVESPASQ